MEETRVQSLQCFEPVIRFYLSFRDGTGDVERVLGRFAALQQAHKGHESEGEVSRPEACLEWWREGPRQEEDLFTKAESGQLLLTPFSRSCAELGFALWPTLFLPATTSGRPAAFPTKVARIHEGREAFTEASERCIGGVRPPG